MFGAADVWGGSIKNSSELLHTRITQAQLDWDRDYLCVVLRTAGILAAKTTLENQRGIDSLVSISELKPASDRQSGVILNEL
jgi:hypothetical protein